MVSPALKPLMSWALLIAVAATSAKSSLVSLIASSFLLIAVLTAVRSSVCWLTTSAVFTNASLFSLTVSVKSARLWSCSATTSFRPLPSKSSALTSSSVAFFAVISLFSLMS